MSPRVAHDFGNNLRPPQKNKSKLYFINCNSFFYGFLADGVRASNLPVEFIFQALIMNMTISFFHIITNKKKWTNSFHFIFVAVI